MLRPLARSAPLFVLWCVMLLLVVPSAPAQEGTPTLTMDQAVQQAQSQLSTPPVVYDITDPGIVYGQLAEGVGAWRASLGGSPNEYGVDTSPVAVQSSVRPDVVPASLQAFLLQYYTDHPTIGLAFGPGGVVSTTLQLQNGYNQAVTQLAWQIYEEANPPASNNDGNTNDNSSNNDSNTNTNTNSNTNTNDNSSNNDDAANNSENIPPLGNNDNGNTNTNSNNNDDPPAAEKEIHVIYFGSET